LMKEKFGDNIQTITTPENAFISSRSTQKAIETFNSMKRGDPIIYGGILHNETDKTYGVPDLIVRSDWLSSIASPWGNEGVPSYEEEEEMKTKAPLLGDNSWHYVIVDIKFSTLTLCSNGKTILNCNSFPSYKSQLYIYTNALGILQGYVPSKAYILGRRWKYTQRGVSFESCSNSCFDRLGVIDYQNFDQQYISKTKSAIQWVRECRSTEAKKWNVFEYPLTRPELYPNMSNTYDSPWRVVKEDIAKQNKELTSLWNVGVREREIAHSRDIYRWNSKECEASKIGIRGKYTQRILNKIIKTNRGVKKRKQKHHPKKRGILKNVRCITKKNKVQLVRPAHIKSNIFWWRDIPFSDKNTPLEFYVDFETINNVMTDFITLPVTRSFGKSNEMVFMIGVGYIDPQTTDWVYKDFTCDKLNSRSELTMSLEFVDFIESKWDEWRGLYPSINNRSPTFVHWASAEVTNWNKIRNINRGKLPNFQWLDLMKLFKDEPITVKGCLGFGLKEVSKAMKSHGFIKSIWEEDTQCIDGPSAMLCAWKASKETSDLRTAPVIQEVKKYNEMDVKVLQEILKYLRINH